MKPMKYLDLMERMDQMIRFRCTGDATEFSNRLGISRRQLYYYIEELKYLGLPISYDRNGKTFFYEKRCMLKIDVYVKELHDSDKVNLQGGVFNINSVLNKTSIYSLPELLCNSNIA